MRRSESQRSIFSSRVPRLAATAVVAAADPAARRLFPAQRDHPRRHRHAAGLSRRSAPRRCRAAVGRLVARLPLQGTHRPDRGVADLQLRRRRRRRPHRPGRRQFARRRRGAAADRRSQRQRDPLARLADRRRRRGRRQRRVAGGSGRSERVAYSTSLSASYEIDFWGKNRAALRAAEELAVASRFDREVVALTTVVSVANSYFLVLEAQDRLAHRAQQPGRRHARLQPDQAALRRRHRLRARHRAAGKPGQHPARLDPAAGADLAAEHRHARGADRPHAGVRDHSRRQHVAACEFRR